MHFSQPRSTRLIACAALVLVVLFGRPPPKPSPTITELHVEVQNLQIRCLTVNWRRRKGPTVVLLHGQAFQAATWQETNTLQVLGGHGVRAVAVDLPGHGETGGKPLPPDAAASFLHGLLKALHVGRRLVMVTPSMSGHYVLPWLVQHSAELTAWVAVAPAGLQKWVAKGALKAASSEAKLKVLGIYGEKDAMRPDFALIEDALPGADLQIIPGAGHPCYRDAPQLFNKMLLRFLDQEVAG